MKTIGILFLILGAALLLTGIACLFASASAYLVGCSVLFSILLNAAGALILTSRGKKR